jgi:hypothetical protein
LLFRAYSWGINWHTSNIMHANDQISLDLVMGTWKRTSGAVL